MSNEDELLTVDNSEEVDQAIQMGEDLQALRKNPHFQRLILDNYLKQSVLGSVSMLAVPQVKEKGRRPDVMEDLIAASNLMFFFRFVDQQYEGTKNPILSDEEEAELEAANQEGVAH